MRLRSGSAARVALLFAAVSACAAQGVLDVPCDVWDAVTSTCTLNQVHVLNCSAPAPLLSNDSSPCMLDYNGSVILSPGAGIVCSPLSPPSLFPSCELFLSTPGSLALLNSSTIQGSSVVVTAGVNVSVGIKANITTTGLGWFAGYGAPVTVGNGASSAAGSGGQTPCLTGTQRLGRLSPYSVILTDCCDELGYYVSSNMTRGSFSAPDDVDVWDDAFGSGTGATSGVPGGGRIRIAAANVRVDGFITADGADASLEGATGAGAGGTIVLDVADGAISGLGMVHANGGKGNRTNAQAAGAGGRLALRYGTITIPTSNLAASSGTVAFQSSTLVPQCLFGSAGTIWLSQVINAARELYYNQLRVGNANLNAYATTMLNVYSNASSAPPNSTVDASVGVDVLTITSSAILASEVLLLRRIYSALTALELRLRGAGDVPHAIAQLHRGVVTSPLTQRAYWRDANVGIPGFDADLSFGLVGVALTSKGTLLPLKEAASLLQASPLGVASYERAPTAPNLTISAVEVEMSGGAVYTGLTALFIDCSNSTVGILSQLLFDGVLSLTANDTIMVEAQVSQRRQQSMAMRTNGPAPVFISEAALYAGRNVALQAGCNLQADVVSVYADGNITVSGMVGSTPPEAVLYSICTQPVQQRERCDEVPWDPLARLPPLSNYTMVLHAPAGQVLVDNNGQVFPNVALICGYTVEVQGPISATGMGCARGEGPGAGRSGSTAGGGGGHGAAGGASADGGLGGIEYDDPQLPLLLGSGGGSSLSEGRSGGGLIRIEAHTSISLDDSSIVDVDGASVSSGESGGGGAGGSLIVKTYDLLGNGKLSAMGGSGQQGGGGGAGGRVRLESFVDEDAASVMQLARTYLTHSNGSNEHLATAQRHAAVDRARCEQQLMNDTSSRAITLQQCRLLYAVHRLLLQAPGSTTEVDIADLHARVAHDIAGNFNGYVTSAGGGGNAGGSAGGAGSIVAPPCPPGYGGIVKCAPCGPGMWRNASAGAGPLCYTCTNKPARGIYTNPVSETAVCSYACPAGTLYPDCVTAIEALVLLFGGIFGFVGTLLGLIVVLGTLVIILCRRRLMAVDAFVRSAGGARMIKTADKSASAGLLAEAHTPGSAHETASKGGYGAAPSSLVSSRFGISALKPARQSQAEQHDLVGMAAVLHLLRAQLGLEEKSFSTMAGGRSRAPLRLHALSSDGSSIAFLQAHAALQEADLPRHVCRIYLGGTNAFGSAWRLPLYPPAAARRMIKSRAYAQFASQVNRELHWVRWGWEELLYVLLSLTVYPIAVQFVSWRQRVRASRLYALVLARHNSHNWLRGARTMALQDGLRVGVSGDITLAYIDILRTERATTPSRSAPSTPSTALVREPRSKRKERNEAPLLRTPGQPQTLRLPLGIMLAGDGSYDHPMHLDANDILVRAVPSVQGLSRFIDNDWIEFVAEFNVRSRCVTAGALIQTCGPLLAYLRGVNADLDLLGGLYVELVRYWPCAKPYVKEGARRHRRHARGGVGGPPTEARAPQSSIAREALRDAAGNAPLASAAAVTPTPRSSRPVANLTRTSSSTGKSGTESDSGSSSSSTSSSSSSSDNGSHQDERTQSQSGLSAPLDAHVGSPVKNDQQLVEAPASAGKNRGSGPSVDTCAVLDVPAPAPGSPTGLDRFHHGSDDEGEEEDGEYDAAGDETEGEGQYEDTTVADGDDEDEAEYDNDGPDSVDRSGCCGTCCGSIACWPCSSCRGVSVPLRGQQEGSNKAGAFWQSFSSLSEDVVGTDDIRLGLLIQMRFGGVAAAALSTPLAASARTRGRKASNAYDSDTPGNSSARRSAPVPIPTLQTSRSRSRGPAQPGQSAGAQSGQYSRADSLMRSYADLDTGYFQLAISNDGVAVVPGSATAPIPQALASSRISAPMDSYSSPRFGAHRLGGSSLLADIDELMLNDPAPGSSPQQAWTPQGISSRYTDRIMHARLPETASAAAAPAPGPPRRGSATRPVSVSSIGRLRTSAPVTNSQLGARLELGPVVVLGSRAIKSMAAGDEALLDDITCCPCVSGNVVCGVLSDIVSRAVVDIGGHDDVLRERLSMSLPYPGVRISMKRVTKPLSFVLPRAAAVLALQRHRLRLRDPEQYALDVRRDRDRLLAFGDGSDSMDGVHSAFMQRVIASLCTLHTRKHGGGTPASAATAPRISTSEHDVSSTWPEPPHPGVSRAARDSTDARNDMWRLDVDDRNSAGSRSRSGSESSQGTFSDSDNGSSSSSTSSSDSALADAYGTRRHKHKRRWMEYTTPAAYGRLFLAGMTCSSLFAGRGACWARTTRRCMFAFGRVLRRNMPTSAQGVTRLYYVVVVLHVMLMAAEIIVALLLVSELWCVEPLSEVGGGTSSNVGADSPRVGAFPDALRASSCNYVPLVLYLSVPPGASLLPPLYGLMAVALQSAPGLRVFAVWNGASLWSTCMALALAAAYFSVLGWLVVAVPFGLIVAKLLSAQCVPLQLAVIESQRPIRSWRGLNEVRNGPVEFAHRAVLRV